jgi:SAM-dependent methyltransferase
LRFSWLYAHPRIYDTALNLIYRGSAQKRFRAVAANVSQGDSVVDLCAGTGALLRDLAPKDVHYRAFDINPVLVEHLRRRGIEAQRLDVLQDDFPEADVVTMCLALYHFHPDCRAVLERMIARARKAVIVLEPVHNAQQSTNRLLRWVGRSANLVDGRVHEFFFEPQSFRALAESFPELREVVSVGNGRDMLAVFEGRAG